MNFPYLLGLHKESHLAVLVSSQGQSAWIWPRPYINHVKEPHRTSFNSLCFTCVTHLKAPITALHSAGSCHRAQRTTGQQKSFCLRQKKTSELQSTSKERPRSSSQEWGGALEHFMSQTHLSVGARVTVPRAFPQQHHNQLPTALCPRVTVATEKRVVSGRACHNAQSNTWPRKLCAPACGQEGQRYLGVH